MTGKHYFGESFDASPVLFMETDGASDEAPKFPKPLNTPVSLFKEL